MSLMWNIPPLTLPSPHTIIQGICNLLWGLAHLQPDLPGWWLHGLAEATLPALRSDYTLQQLCTLM